MAKPYKSLSVGVNQPEPFELTDEKVGASALVRIADAVEVMAQDYVRMRRDLENYKKWYQDLQHEIGVRDNTIRTLKGVITRLKNQRNRLKADPLKTESAS